MPRCPDPANPGRGTPLLRHIERWRWSEIVAPAVCLGVMLVVGAWPNGFFETSRNWLFDTYQRLSPAERAQPRTVVIDIDAESIRRIGQWPWPRDRLARLIDRAKEARVIGIDLLLSEPDRVSPENWIASQPDLAPEIRNAVIHLPSTDAVLADSIARAPVVMAAVAVPRAAPQPRSTVSASAIVEEGTDPRPNLPRYAAALRPLPRLAEAARGLGIVTMQSEPDGVLRRVPAILAVGDELMPSFVLEILRQWIGADHIIARGGAIGLREVAVGPLLMSTDPRGRVWIRYASEGPGRYVPAYSVLESEFDPAVFRNQIVLIGVSAPGLGDVIMSPLRHPERGVSVHAQLIENLLAGDALWRSPGTLGAELLLGLVLGSAAILFFGRVPPGIHVPAFSGFVVLLITVSWLAFTYFGLLLDWTFPVAALVVSGGAVVTARLRAEVQTRRQREVELERALMAAEAADRSKTEFLANVSHELRTPLSAILGFSEIMKDQVLGPLLPTYTRYVTDIYNSGTHLLGIIQGVLELSVLDLGGAQPGHDSVDVPASLIECTRMAAVRAEARSVTIAHEFAPALPQLRADARMFKQMVLNLLSNAVKYSPPGEQVTVAAGLAGERLFVSVRDRGRGIAEGDVAKALMPFGRLQSARLAQEPGIGIGLSLTRSMVELHDGQLEIRSEVGSGTEVLLWFPPTRLDKGITS